MSNAIYGAVGGLIVGTLGALAFDHLIEGDTTPPVPVDVKHVVIAGSGEENKGEVEAMSAQIQQLTTTNDDLKHQLETVKSAAPSGPPPINPMIFAGMMRGWGQTQQKLLLLKSRLHLTPDQATAVQAAMEADAKQRQQLMRQMFQRGQGGQGGPGGQGGAPGGQANAPGTPAVAANPNSLDQTLASVLTPDQLTAYKQVQADEQTSQADTRATTQVNQVAPLLQLSDSQKDQVYNALYQVQMAAPDPVSLIGNPNAVSILQAQSQATDAALAKVLTPDQMALYQQEVQAAPQFRGRGGGGGGAGGAPAGGQ